MILQYKHTSINVILLTSDDLYINILNVGLSVNLLD